MSYRDIFLKSTENNSEVTVISFASYGTKRLSVLNTFLRKFRKHWYIPSNPGSRSFHIFFLDAIGVSNQSDWRELSRWGLEKQTEEVNYDSDAFFFLSQCVTNFKKYNSYSQIKLLWILRQSKWSIMIDHNRSQSGNRINLISVSQSCFFILVPVMFLICSSTIIRETEAAKVDLKYKKHNNHINNYNKHT